ncbi:MAG: phage minor head protein [Rickettsiales bacterium]
MTLSTLCDFKLFNDALRKAFERAGFSGAAQKSQDMDAALFRHFIQYKSGEIRRVWPMEKAQSYIWRTEEDDKVRLSHAINDGKIFSWNNPPAIGHPGEDYNCRCWAEPLQSDRIANQYQITKVMDNANKWGNAELAWHYESFSGEGVTLEQIGLMQDFIDYYADYAASNENSEPGVYKRVNAQVIDKALNTPDGKFTEYFSNAYKFTDFLFSFGDSRVDANFAGSVRRKDGYLVINGIVTYSLNDMFADPFDIGFEFGKPYSITGTWKTKLNATVKID